MASKKLTNPAAVFDAAAAAVRRSVDTVPVQPRPFPRKSREADLGRQENLSDRVYPFRVKSGKKMSEPIRDDSLIGGYSNLRGMSSAQAHRYALAKQQAKEEAAEKAKQERVKAYNPFEGFDSFVNDTGRDDMDDFDF